MAEDSRTIIARWIEQKRQERDAPALSWVIQRAAFALFTCYPKGQGSDALWALFRTIAGQEPSETQERPPGRREEG